MSKSVMPALVLALLAGAAHADGDYVSPTDDRVRVTLGAMHVSTETMVRVDSSTGVMGTTARSTTTEPGFICSTWFVVMACSRRALSSPVTRIRPRRERSSRPALF